MVGRTLSHYQIVGEISRGGMGVVYRALDINLGREIALKVLPDDLVHDRLRRERLVHEARAASSLEHPNVAVIHEVGDADGVTFIAMELIRGEKLSETLSRGALPPARAFALATEMAEGLARAHERGIVHRDFKPANVMLTDDGHAKIIDFGLAKLVGNLAPDAATVSIDGPRTDAGVVIGTAAYMSPEQARGERVDHRTDIFAFGVTLYEMLTGRPAFQGRSAIETMHAILTQPVPPLPPGPGFSTETLGDLHRIIAKCTAKESEDRYQGIKDLIVDLRAARRRSESAAVPAVSSASAPPRPGAGVRQWRLAAAIVLVAACGAALAWWLGRPQPAAPAAPGKPAVAVLYFDNITGDPSLDWMRTGLTDMIVTDLSQSTNIEVLGTDRLVEILQDLKRADDRVISADLVRDIAQRAGVDKVLVGSYVKAGDTIRITARLQEAATGRIVTSERVEGNGQAALFSLVDELTRRFRSKISDMAAAAGTILAPPGRAEEAGLDRGVNEITTSSIEAYRYYADGMHFHERGLTAQGIPLVQKAIEIDPGFAMAHAKLAVLNGNMGRLNERDASARRALASIDRLTARERYYIEGFYYGLQAETRPRSIEAYQNGLALHPEHQASRHNLGLHLLTLERYDECIAQYEELLRRGTSNPISYENLAAALIQTGDLRRGVSVAEDFNRRYPDSASGLRNLGAVLIADGRLDEAERALTKAKTLNPLDPIIDIARWNIAVLQERWTAAEALSEEFARSANPFQRFLAEVGRQQLAAARGRGAVLRETTQRAAEVPGLGAQQRGAAVNRSASTFLRHGQPDLALARAEVALEDSRNRDPEFETLQIITVAQAALGRPEAEKTLAHLEARARALAPQRELRRLHWTRGLIAQRRGELATAAAELTKAVQMMPPHGPPLGPPSVHGELWFDAAVALIAAKRDADAAPLLERLQAAYERVYAMEVYARSFYLLGQIEERRGNDARARLQYGRFLELWRDGDLERGWVADAEKKVIRAQGP